MGNKMMNDFEICKRIAEIEGMSIKEAAHYKRIVNGAGICTGFQPHNPLTDDALCFQLMIKYKLSLLAPEGEQEDWDCVVSDVLTTNTNPNKAICLAIIEAHKENK